MQLPVAQLSLVGLTAAGLALLRVRRGEKEGPDKIDCLDLSSWNAEKPHKFYLSGDSLFLTDCEATVEDVRLPLHTTVLAKQCQALRQVLEQHINGGTVSALGKSCALLQNRTQQSLFHCTWEI